MADRQFVRTENGEADRKYKYNVLVTEELTGTLNRFLGPDSGELRGSAILHNQVIICESGIALLRRSRCRRQLCARDVIYLRVFSWRPPNQPMAIVKVAAPDNDGD